MSLEGATETDPAGTTERPSLADRLDTRRILLGVLGSLVFLVVWQAGAMAVGRELAKTETLALPLIGEVTGSKLLIKLVQSLMHYLPGLLIGTVLGIALGIAMGWSPTVEDLFTPVTRILRPIPPLAWI
ncbi:MAG: ABC transporter permease, partial [Candidatus Nanohaloarchaea archaeon]